VLLQALALGIDASRFGAELRPAMHVNQAQLLPFSRQTADRLLSSRSTSPDSAPKVKHAIGLAVVPMVDQVNPPATPM